MEPLDPSLLVTGPDQPPGDEAAGPFAAVAVDIAAASTDRPFHYSIPPHLAGRLSPGQRVLVPFGPRLVEGLLLGFDEAAEVARVRPIARVLEAAPSLAPAQLELARWLADRYLCRLVQALRVFLAPGARGEKVRPLVERRVRLRVAGDGGQPGQLGQPGQPGRLGPKQQVVLNFLRERGGAFTRGQLEEATGAGPGVVRGLLEKGLLEEVRTEVRRDPAGAGRDGAAGAVGPGIAPRPALRPAQGVAVAALESALAGGEAAVFLLHGVTGSGKTEVYLRAIEGALARGRQAALLVPEIALTPQMVQVVRERLGSRVAVLHSALSAGERYDEWRRLQAGEADVVLGARSAIFAPLARPGVIIVDEEHETSYKQEEVPRYHAREVAIRRGEQAGAPVLLGSATPALESYHAAREGRYRLLELPERATGSPLPPVELVDMREELRLGNRSIFSRGLRDGVAEALGRREQVILFLNRRGFRTFVMCRECGASVRCPHCAVSLTLHLPGQQLQCHYCRHQQAPPDACPTCGGRRIRYFGAGTQEVEEQARAAFPEARVLRMDVDTTGRKGDHERIYRQFRRGEADILVGTQMVAKGWDIEGVTLVGVVSADTAIHLPDFRAGERTFQLLTQVAGRAGRGRAAGRVLVQSYSPEHYAIQAASRHDYHDFFQQEIAIRRAAGFPPFASLVRLVLAHPDDGEAARLARLAGEAALGLGAQPTGGLAGTDADLSLLGPAPAPLARLHGRHRWHLCLKASRRETATAAAGEIARHVEAQGTRDLLLSLDPDPLSML